MRSWYFPSPVTAHQYCYFHPRYPIMLWRWQMNKAYHYGLYCQQFECCNSFLIFSKLNAKAILENRTFVYNAHKLGSRNDISTIRLSSNCTESKNLYMPTYLGFLLRLTVSLSVDSLGGDGPSASGSLAIVSVFWVRGVRSGLLGKTRQSLHIAANNKNSVMLIPYYSTEN